MPCRAARRRAGRGASEGNPRTGAQLRVDDGAESTVDARGRDRELALEGKPPAPTQAKAGAAARRGFDGEHARGHDRLRPPGLPYDEWTRFEPEAERQPPGRPGEHVAAAHREVALAELTLL